MYDEIHEQYGGYDVDLAANPGIYDRGLWSVDRLHPSEGSDTAHSPTSSAASCTTQACSSSQRDSKLDGAMSSTWHKVGWMMSEIVPWLGRRHQRSGTRDRVPPGSMPAESGSPNS